MCICMQGMKVDRVQSSGRKSGGNNRLYVPRKHVCRGKSTPRGERNYRGGQRKGKNMGMERSYLTPFLCMSIIKLIS